MTFLNKIDSRERIGRWTPEEHRLFLRGLDLHGKGWKKIADMIKTRTIVQIRTHAQKYFQKLTKLRLGGFDSMDGHTVIPYNSKSSIGKLMDGSVSSVLGISRESYLLDDDIEYDIIPNNNIQLEAIPGPIVDNNFFNDDDDELDDDDDDVITTTDTNNTTATRQQEPDTSDQYQYPIVYRNQFPYSCYIPLPATSPVIKMKRKHEKSDAEPRKRPTPPSPSPSAPKRRGRKPKALLLLEKQMAMSSNNLNIKPASPTLSTASEKAKRQKKKSPVPQYQYNYSSDDFLVGKFASSALPFCSKKRKRRPKAKPTVIIDQQLPDVDCSISTKSSLLFGAIESSTDNNNINNSNSVFFPDMQPPMILSNGRKTDVNPSSEKVVVKRDAISLLSCVELPPTRINLHIMDGLTIDHSVTFKKPSKAPLSPIDIAIPDRCGLVDIEAGPYSFRRKISDVFDDRCDDLYKFASSDEFDPFANISFH